MEIALEIASVDGCCKSEMALDRSLIVDVSSVNSLPCCFKRQWGQYKSSSDEDSSAKASSGR